MQGNYMELEALREIGVVTFLRVYNSRRRRHTAIDVLVLFLKLQVTHSCRMAPYKRKTDRALVTAATTEDAKRKLEAGKSKREVAREMGINECTLRKNLKAPTCLCCLLQGTIPVPLGRSKRALTDDMERELAQHCRDLDSRFYDITRKHVI
ncbi:hypothetical protein PR048_021375 [Dryococelus australis]|uniref:HTH psq-type domain-containing protein n=1 Tax=Dryococelus australis TaxID=614101 RepID=A0ABQ9GY34_9NEOP|nr:hypothetical protein PR048_021375 [Dryococelus australis]